MIEIHPSALAEWMQCEKRGIHRALFPKPPAGPRIEHISAWVGTAVHALVADDPVTPPPQFRQFDKLTPTISVAYNQIHFMATAIREHLETLHWTPIASELHLPPVPLSGLSWSWPDELRLTGTIDLLAERWDDRGIIADIKTGKTLHKGWMQLGAYALRYAYDAPEVDGVELPVISELAIIHCPRPAVMEKPTVTVDTRPTKPLLVEATRALKRVIENTNHPDFAPATPSERCRFCDHPTCPVRVQDYNPRGVRNEP